MSKEILIHVQKEERQVAIVENGRVEDFHIELDRYQSLLGNIYKGKVESILPSINAAFVNIGQEKNGFLYLTDALETSAEEEKARQEPRSFLEKIFRKRKESPAPALPPEKSKEGSRHIPLKVGQEILVQVEKDPFGDKGARLTTHISLPWRFVVYMPLDRQAGVSRKIENIEERKRFRDLMKSFTFATTGGFIIRTAALKQGDVELFREARSLHNLWLDIRKKAEGHTAPSLVYAEGELTWKIVRDYLTEKVDLLIIDSQEEYHKICKFVEKLIGRGGMVDKVQLYQGAIPLFEAKGVSKDLKKIYDTHVYSKSGAYIVIEPTEGITVIDVNSGKFKTKASPGEAAFMVNMEVVPEIARQLRLRDLGGIIVIDFIDMEREDHKRRVLDALQKALTRDDAKTEVFKISPLGLVEMTRARTGKNIESISFGKCPFCHGRGRVKIS